MGSCLVGTVSVWEDERVLEMMGIAAQFCEYPQHLKLIKVVNFILFLLLYLTVL